MSGDEGAFDCWTLVVPLRDYCKYAGQRLPKWTDAVVTIGLDRGERDCCDRTFRACGVACV